MTVTNPSNFIDFRVSGIDRTADILRLETWRIVNGVGTWKAVLRNTAGKYNNVFDVQNLLLASVNHFADVVMRGVVDGPAVTLTGRDLESDWDEYVELRGVDRAQDLLFHNDFDYEYPNNTTQTLNDILNNVFNTQLAGLTNIIYVPLGGTPVIGAASFKEGGNFLGSLQELMRRSVYVFYVDDNYELRTGAPGFSATAFVARSRQGDITNSIIGDVTLQERDGDKHYNYVKLYGKNPMFDAYTEFNAADWTGEPINTSTITNDTDVPILNSQYSLKSVPDGAWVPALWLTFSPTFNYSSIDLTKGIIGFWAKYTDAAGGEAGAGVRIFLRDTANNMVNYLSKGVGSTQMTTRLYKDIWGWCQATLGESVDAGAGPLDHWILPAPFTSFDWAHVNQIIINYNSDSGVTVPDALYIDGLTLPVPPIGIVENVGAQGTYRRRPYVDSWSHIRTQNAIQRSAEMVLAQSDSTYIDLIKFMVPGSPLLKYAGQTITVDIPGVGMNAELFYTTSLHHIIEPYSDVSGGYGFDWVTEVEAAPVSGIAFDHSRLGRGPLYGSYQRGDRIGVGMGAK